MLVRLDRGEVSTLQYQGIRTIFSAIDKYGNNLLHIAVQRGFSEAVRKLSRWCNEEERRFRRQDGLTAGILARRLGRYVDEAMIEARGDIYRCEEILLREGRTTAGEKRRMEYMND